MGELEGNEGIDCRVGMDCRIVQKTDAKSNGVNLMVYWMEQVPLIALRGWMFHI
jgi:hypothetical protein